MNFLLKSSLVALLPFILASHHCLAEEETAEQSAKQNVEKAAGNDKKNSSQTQKETGTSGDFASYEEQDLKQRSIRVREDWKDTPSYREVNGLSYLEFESARKSRGHFFLFPSWNTTYQAVSLARLASSQDFDSFVFFPQPDLDKITPSSENQKQKESVLSKYLEYAEVAISTIGSHERTNIYLGEGNTLSWILSGIEEGRIPEPDGIIALNAFYRDQDSNTILAEQISTCSGNFLDIITYDDNNWLQDAARKRLFLLKKSGKSKLKIRIINSSDKDYIYNRFSAYMKKTDFSRESKK